MPPARPAPTGPALAALGLASLAMLGACGAADPGSPDLSGKNAGPGPTPGTPGDERPGPTPSSPGAPAVRSFSTEALGVRLQVRLLPGPEDPAPAVEAAFAEARRLEALVNLWDPGSALSRWNARSRTLPAGPLALDPGLAELLAPALAVSAASGGALDPTVAPVLRELGFYGDEATADLDETARAGWRTRTGHGAVALEPDGATVRRDLPGMELDLSALAKGVAADRMAALLRDGGVPSALVSAGSSLVAFGPGPDGAGWPLELPHPDGPRTVQLRDEAASTSGASSITLEGRHAGRSHLLDPRTLAPVDHRTEMVVVRGPDGATCDLWSTALLVLGLDELEAWWPGRPAAARGLAATVYASSPGSAPQGGPPVVVELAP